MAYQSAEALFSHCGGDGRVLVRITGTRARVREGGQNGDMTQRAKAGYCPRCTRHTHFASPSFYQAGGRPAHKAHGIQSRTEHGPWAVRYFAGAVYAHKSGYLPYEWGWAAHPLALKPPT